MSEIVDYRSRFDWHTTPFTREIRVADRFVVSDSEQVLGRLLGAVQERMSAALIAPPGTGKTTLLRALMDRLPETRYRLHYVKVTDLSKRDLCREVAAAMSCDFAGTYPSLVRRLQERFAATLDSDGLRLVLVLDEAHDIRPEVLGILRLLLLDPLVRLHRLDENSAADMARLLGFLRQLQRRHRSAILLFHHTGKKQRLSDGQNLRGSSDLHAFGDSNLYLARRRQGLTLSIEHRAAPAPQPLAIELVCPSDGSDPHLQVSTPAVGSDSKLLAERAWSILQTSLRPLTRSALRALLRVNNQRLGTALDQLQHQGQALRTP